MRRILLVDHSPHALRMGERILEEEGYQVVALANADSAIIRLEDVDPDVVIADAAMPGRTGYEICQYLKMNPRHRHVRVILTTSSLESVDPERFQGVAADGELKKPFEASALIAAVKPLAEAAAQNRPDRAGPVAAAGQRSTASAPFVAVVDAAEVRAAVTVALDAAMESLVGEISRRVIEALQPRQSAPAGEPEGPRPAAPPAAATAPEPQPAAPLREAGSRPQAFRKRSGSILGLSLEEWPPEAPSPPARAPGAPE